MNIVKTSKYNMSKELGMKKNKTYLNKNEDELKNEIENNKISEDNISEELLYKMYNLMFIKQKNVRDPKNKNIKNIKFFKFVINYYVNSDLNTSIYKFNSKKEFNWNLRNLNYGYKYKDMLTYKFATEEIITLLTESIKNIKNKDKKQEFRTKWIELINNCSKNSIKSITKSLVNNQKTSSYEIYYNILKKELAKDDCSINNILTNLFDDIFTAFPNLISELKQEFDTRKYSLNEIRALTNKYFRDIDFFNTSIEIIENKKISNEEQGNNQLAKKIVYDLKKELDNYLLKYNKSKFDRNGAEKKHKKNKNHLTQEHFEKYIKHKFRNKLNNYLINGGKTIFWSQYFNQELDNNANLNHDQLTVIKNLEVISYKIATSIVSYNTLTKSLLLVESEKLKADHDILNLNKPEKIDNLKFKEGLLKKILFSNYNYQFMDNLTSDVEDKLLKLILEEVINIRHNISFHYKPKDTEKSLFGMKNDSKSQEIDILYQILAENLQKVIEFKIENNGFIHLLENKVDTIDILQNINWLESETYKHLSINKLNFNQICREVNWLKEYLTIEDTTLKQEKKSAIMFLLNGLYKDEFIKDQEINEKLIEEFERSEIKAELLPVVKKRDFKQFRDDIQRNISKFQQENEFSKEKELRRIEQNVYQKTFINFLQTKQYTVIFTSNKKNDYELSEIKKDLNIQIDNNINELKSGFNFLGLAIFISAKQRNDLINDFQKFKILIEKQTEILNIDLNEIEIIIKNIRLVNFYIDTIPNEQLEDASKLVKEKYIGLYGEEQGFLQILEQLIGSRENIQKVHKNLETSGIENVYYQSDLVEKNIVLSRNMLLMMKYNSFNILLKNDMFKGLQQEILSRSTEIKPLTIEEKEELLKMREKREGFTKRESKKYIEFEEKNHKYNQDLNYINFNKHLEYTEILHELISRLNYLVVIFERDLKYMYLALESFEENKLKLEGIYSEINTKLNDREKVGGSFFNIWNNNNRCNWDKYEKVVAEIITYNNDSENAFEQFKGLRNKIAHLNSFTGEENGETEKKLFGRNSLFTDIIRLFKYDTKREKAVYNMVEKVFEQFGYVVKYDGTDLKTKSMVIPTNNKKQESRTKKIETKKIKLIDQKTLDYRSQEEIEDLVNVFNDYKLKY